MARNKLAGKDAAGSLASSGRTNVNSLKSTCVILILAGVLYGVYVTLNSPPPNAGNPSSQQLAEIQPPSIDFGPASAAPSLDAPAPGTIGLPPLMTNPPLIAPVSHGEPVSPVGSNSPATTTPPDLAIEQPSPNAPTYAPPSETPAVEAPAAKSESAANGSTPALEAYKLKQAWQTVERHVQDGKLRDALAELSPFASNSQLSPDDRRAVYTWLDALAGKVIYGPEHYLHEPFKVTGKGQTLYDVAKVCNVEPQLLLNINSHQVSDPVVLLPGTDLKVVPGPFRAELSLSKSELTLFVGPLYAGRFAFTIGDERPQPGTYRVQEKRRDRPYYARDGRQLAANDPNNPYGGWCLDLGKEVSLHGSPANSGQGPALGCLSFSPLDAQDLYGILSLQSEVVIKP